MCEMRSGATAGAFTAVSVGRVYVVGLFLARPTRSPIDRLGPRSLSLCQSACRGHQRSERAPRFNAISTSIAKSVGEITPKSRPMFMTISSLRPRVFMSVPRDAESRHPMRAPRAATRVPPNFPSVAIRIIKPQTNQFCHPDISPICVRIPVNAKKAGSSRIVTESRSRILSSMVPGRYGTRLRTPRWIARSRLSAGFLGACCPLNLDSCLLTSPSRRKWVGKTTDAIDASQGPMLGECVPNIE